MAIVLANAKKPDLLEEQRTYLNTLELHLFTNNITPDGDTDTGDFTECADSGYDPVIDVGFAASTLNGDDQGETLAPPVTWVFTHAGGDFTVRGYYFTDPNDSDALVFSERAASDFVVTAAGSTYTVTPRALLDTL